MQPGGSSDLDVLGSFRLDSRIVVVTGAPGSGIGRACAVACAEAGADVACLDVDAVEAAATGAAATALGRRALVVQADVAVEHELEEAFGRVDDELGVADVAFANAGIAGQAAISRSGR